jgi:hypothetical protein
MDRALLRRHLAQTERYITEGERHIADQRDLIVKLERDGHDTVHARRLLIQFEELQALHIAARERLQAQLVVMR